MDWDITPVLVFTINAKHVVKCKLVDCCGSIAMSFKIIVFASRNGKNFPDNICY